MRFLRLVPRDKLTVFDYRLSVHFSGLERLLRDGKAGWVMGASNEVLRQVVGKTSLFGLGAVDFW